MKQLRSPSVNHLSAHSHSASVRPLIISLCQVYAVILLLFLLLPFAASAASLDTAQRQWAGNWLVVGEGDEQLVWQLNADGSGYAYGFAPGGRLSHGFAISWRLEGDRVRVRTGALLRCNGGQVKAQFTGWSPVTLDFAIVNGNHWRQEGGGALSFQRRLSGWKTPTDGSECPSLGE